MAVRVTFRPDPSGAADVLVKSDLLINRLATRTEDEARSIIQQEGRVDTGALMQSIEHRRVTKTPREVTYEIGTGLSYAKYQHEGVEGPIYPRRSKFLRFKPRGSSTFVFAKKVSGFKGIFFMTRALDRSTDHLT